MTRQAETWVRHTERYLEAVDPALVPVFRAALAAAGYPDVAAATALEHLCADFLAGPTRCEGSEPEATPP